jgi:hypothetical protein
MRQNTPSTAASPLFSCCDKQFELIHHEIIDLEEAAMSARRAKY